MASGLVSHVQLASTELALKAIEKQQALQEASNSNIPDSVDESTSATTAQPVNAVATVSAISPMVEAIIDNDIAHPAFMNDLKIWLAELSADSANAVRGKAMMDAFAEGALKVFDPVAGIVVTARDLSIAPVSKIHTDTISAIGWSQFLKQRVRRDDGANYAKDADGCYLDEISGEKAYFGAVGNKFYYFTWPQPNSVA